MKAIILAAGTGTRLGKYTQNLPKCMLNFAGKTLIEKQVDGLRSVGIDEIIIIKGYQPEAIKIPGARYYINPDFQDTNMVETLFCAEKELSGDILVCYSDIMYEKRVLEAILSSNVEIGVTVDDDYLPYWKARLDNYQADMESLIIGPSGNIVELGRPNSSEENAKMRYVGLIKFSSKGIEKFKEIYHQEKEKYYMLDKPWRNSKSFKKGYMTDMLQAVIDSGFKVDPIVIRRGWMEFDTVEDYEKAVDWVKTGEIDKYIKL